MYIEASSASGGTLFILYVSSYKALLMFLLPVCYVLMGMTMGKPGPDNFIGA